MRPTNSNIAFADAQRESSMNRITKRAYVIPRRPPDSEEDAMPHTADQSQHGPCRLARHRQEPRSEKWKEVTLMAKKCPSEGCELKKDPCWQQKAVLILGVLALMAAVIGKSLKFS